MNYAIQSETCTFPYLQVTARKRSNKHSLIQVNQGLMLFRLGKHEYVIEASQALWIPIDCLCALTFFPNTEVTRVDFSVRLTTPFPSQAGLVQHNDVTRSVLQRLQQSVADTPVYPYLLQVLKYEVQNFEPKLKLSGLSHQVSQWNPESAHKLSKELHLVLLVREARKRRLSGVPLQSVIDGLFAGENEQYQQLCQLLLGEVP